MRVSAHNAASSRIYDAHHPEARHERPNFLPQAGTPIKD